MQLVHISVFTLHKKFRSHAYSPSSVYERLPAIMQSSSLKSLPPFSHPAPIPIKQEGGYERLKIGYVSSDFGNHPLSHLMGSVFGMHNSKNVEVFCYALSPNDGTEWRQRIQSEAEHFVDVSAMTSDLIAKLINEDKIQILINLNSYTKGTRNEIFSMKPAPIQVYMYILTEERM